MSSDIPEARSLTLRCRRPLAPPFHRHIARARLLDSTRQVGDTVVVYDIVAVEPAGPVRVTAATQLLFE